ncbi:MAG: cupin domain-containing protein, partial [Actinomycetota bacterium]|nr:cupin domain-containing protein [Actinomycetota bacterium]
HRGVARLADLVGDPDLFVADDFSRRVRCYPGIVAPGFLADPERLWDDVLARGTRAPAFRIVREGDTLARQQYTRSAGIGTQTVDDVIEPNRVLELFEEGASLVLQGLQFTDPALGRLANNLALDLEHPVQVNAYLSPAAARGLDIHFDYHDVLIVQLSGTKRWRVWERLERTRWPVRGAPGLAAPTLEELDEPVLDRTLRPGDCVHIPRGCPHAPETIDDESVHLTIGIMALTRQRLIERALASTLGAAETAELVPTASLGASGDERRALKLAANEIADALDAIGEALSGGSLRRLLAEAVWTRQPATRMRPRHPPVLADDTTLTVAPGPLLWAEHTGTELTLGLGDRHLRLPVEAWPVVRSVLDEQRQTFSVADLAAELRRSIDADSLRTVISKLAREGVVAGG